MTDVYRSGSHIVAERDTHTRDFNHWAAACRWAAGLPPRFPQDMRPWWWLTWWGGVR